jgi:hypothetical protein
MPENVAILVIHGIGQQSPYETIDQFTQGLVDSFQAGNVTCSLEPRLAICHDPLREQKQWVQASCRLTFLSGGDNTPVQAPFQSGSGSSIEGVSLYEYYWAPITQDKITYRGSLLFLIRAGLTPFKYLAANVTVLSAVGNKRRIPIVILKELWRQLSLFLPLLALFASLLAFVSAYPPTRLLDVYRATDGASFLLVAILAVRYLYLWTTARALLGSLRGKGTWQASGVWRLCLLAALTGHIVLWPVWISGLLGIFACCGRWLGHKLTLLPMILGHWANPVHRLQLQTRLPHGQGLKAWLNALFFLKSGFSHYQYLSLAGCMLAAYVVRFILVDYVGDIAVYVNTDEFSSSFSARSQILDGCTHALSQILRERKDPADPESSYLYDRVLIAAHSLGSVIAYDTLNELLDRARSAAAGDLQPEDLDKLRGMITFGCPLNKIFYFFREQIPPVEALRRQLLDVLHSFRVVASLRTYGFANSQPMSTNPDPNWSSAEQYLESGFRWINAYALMDPISGLLSFYDLQSPQNQKLFHYLKPGLAHLEYWTDPNFYEFFRGRLL